MRFKTHLLFGFLIALISISYFEPSNIFLFFLVVLISSILPDIDHPRSKLGKNIKIIGFLFEHRAFFHSILIVAIVNLVVWFVWDFNIYLIGFNLGYISHILLDALNKKGIMPFHPLSRKKIHGFIEIDSILEKILFLIILFLTAYKILTLF